MLRHKILDAEVEVEPSQGNITHKTCEELRFKANKLVRVLYLFGSIKPMPPSLQSFL